MIGISSCFVRHLFWKTQRSEGRSWAVELRKYTPPCIPLLRKLCACTPGSSNPAESNVLCSRLTHATHVTIYLSITSFPVKREKQNGVTLVLGHLRWKGSVPLLEQVSEGGPGWL